jgi:hypothetical protein
VTLASVSLRTKGKGMWPSPAQTAPGVRELGGMPVERAELSHRLLVRTGVQACGPSDARWLARCRTVREPCQTGPRSSCLASRLVRSPRVPHPTPPGPA